MAAAVTRSLAQHGGGTASFSPPAASLPQLVFAEVVDVQRLPPLAEDLFLLLPLRLLLATLFL